MTKLQAKLKDLEIRVLQLEHTQDFLIDFIETTLGLKNYEILDFERKLTSYLAQHISDDDEDQIEKEVSVIE